MAKDAVTAAVAVFGAWIAWKGLGAWKRQLAGRTQYEVARALLKATYEVRDAAEWARSPFVPAAEMTKAARDFEYEPEEPRNVLDRQPYVYAIFARINELNARLRAFQLEALEAEVLWSGARRGTDAVLKATRDISLALQLHAEEEGSGVGHRAPDYLGHLRRAFTGTTKDPEDDELGAAMRAAVAGVEALARPHLSAE